MHDNTGNAVIFSLPSCGICKICLVGIALLSVLLSFIPCTHQQYNAYNGTAYNASYANGSYSNYGYGPSYPYAYAYPYPVAGRGVDYGAYNNFCNNISNFILRINNTNGVTNTNQMNSAQVMNENNLNNSYNISIKTYIYGPLCTFHASVVYPPAPPPQPIQYTIYQLPPEEEEEEVEEEPEIEIIVEDANPYTTRPTVVRAPPPYVPPPEQVQEWPAPEVPVYGRADGQYGSQAVDYAAAGSEYQPPSDYQNDGAEYDLARLFRTADPQKAVGPADSQWNYRDLEFPPRDSSGYPSSQTDYMRSGQLADYRYALSPQYSMNRAGRSGDSAYSSDWPVTTDVLFT